MKAYQADEDKDNVRKCGLLLSSLLKKVSVIGLWFWLSGQVYVGSKDLLLNLALKQRIENLPGWQRQG